MVNYQELVANASPDLVADGMRLIKANNLSRSFFLPDSNPLKNDSVGSLKAYFGRSLIIDPDDVKSYLATSCIMHCFDGWLYLSHAIDSLVKGDKGISIHLAYYSELRACISFLARQGVLVNNRQHIAIGNDGVLSCSNTSETHSASWDLLEEWINSRTVNHSIILKYFSIRNNSLYDWVNYVPYAITPAIAGRFTLDWLREWSFDIQNFRKDRRSRNIVSYQPQRLIDTSRISLRSMISGILNLWRFIEPNGSDRFSLLDRYIFKLLFEKIHFYLKGNHPALTLEHLVESTFARCGISGDPVISHLINSGTSHQVLDLSKTLTIQETSGTLTPLTIISRALLMLRISSGAAFDLLREADVTNQDIEFYLNPIGVENGHWKGSTPPQFQTLWDDLEDSLVAIEDLLEESSTITLHDIYSNHSSDLNKFKQISRACFWGTCH